MSDPIIKTQVIMTVKQVLVDPADLQKPGTPIGTISVFCPEVFTISTLDLNAIALDAIQTLDQAQTLIKEDTESAS